MDRLYNPFDQWKNLKVKSLIFPDDSLIEAKDAIEIIPYGQTGDMGWTLWFEARHKDGRIIRHNGAHVACVEIEEEEQPNA